MSNPFIEEEFRIDNGPCHKCDVCEEYANVFSHRYDDNLQMYSCDCGHEEWICDVPSEPNPRVCPLCDKFATDEQVESEATTQCSKVGCLQLVHLFCVENDEAAWNCEIHE